MATKPSITPARLRELLDCDAETGAFIWRAKRGHVIAGTRAAETEDRYGYVSIKVCGRRYKAHRLAFLWVMGTWPDGLLDHADGDYANNSWKNLRSATFTQNRGNSKKPKNNTSGFKGVTKCKNSSKNPWIAKIKHNRISYHLGRHACPTRAWLEYARRARALYGAYANDGTGKAIA